MAGKNTARFALVMLPPIGEWIGRAIGPRKQITAMRSEATRLRPEEDLLSPIRRPLALVVGRQNGSLRRQREFTLSGHSESSDQATRVDHVGQEVCGDDQITASITTTDSTTTVS